MKAMPSMPGMRTSVKIRSGVRDISARSAGSAASKLSTMNPAPASAFSSTKRIERSSSTSQTVRRGAGRSWALMLALR